MTCIIFSVNDSAHFSVSYHEKRIAGQARIFSRTKSSSAMDGLLIDVSFSAFPVEFSLSHAKNCAEQVSSMFGRKWVTGGYYSHAITVSDTVYGFEVKEKENIVCSLYDSVACAAIVGGNAIVIRPGMNGDAIAELQKFFAQYLYFKGNAENYSIEREKCRKIEVRRRARPKTLASLAKDLATYAATQDTDSGDTEVYLRIEENMLVLNIGEGWGPSSYYRLDEPKKGKVRQ